MLEDIRQSYLSYAKNIPNWDTMNKNDLANLYIKYEKNENLRNNYFSALMCRYWHAIGKYYFESRNSVDIEDCYEWLIHALTYALKNRKWTDPKNKLFNDPAGPDKVINRCIASTRQIFYQASNTAKRRVNFQCDSIDRQLEAFGDSASIMVEVVDDNQSYLVSDTCKDIVKKYLDEDKIIEALIIDGICFQDSFKENKDIINKDGEEYDSYSYEFNDRKLVKHLNNISKPYIAYFAEKYNFSTIKLLQTLEIIKNLSNTRLYTSIRKTLYDLKNNTYVRNVLCY